MLRVRLPVLALPLVLACGPQPPPQTEPPPVAPPTVAEDPLDLDAWIAQLEQAGARDRAELDGLLADAAAKFGESARVDESVDDPCAGTPATFGGVQRLDGQLDADPQLETAVIVRLAVTDRMGPSERCEETWLGLFDRSASAFRLALRSHRITYHCLADEREAALTAAFTSGTPGPEAAFRMERQDVGACGTLVNYRYQVFDVRGASDGVVIERQPPTESVSFDRTEAVEPPAP
jgi:hypothetical protein